MGHNINSKVGTYTGTGAAIQINLNFQPKFLKIWNETDGTKTVEVIQGLADGKCYYINDTGVGTTDLSVIASQGITLGSNGFSVGTDASVNTNAKVYRFFAIG